MSTGVIIGRVSAGRKIDGRAESARGLGDRIVTSSNTKIICGTFIIVAGMFAVVYLSSSEAPDLAALGIIGTIVTSVLAGTFGLARLDRIEQRVARVQQQTNGELDGRIERVVEQRLRAAGQPPLDGQSLAERDA